jgi:hypothetical protein
MTRRIFLPGADLQEKFHLWTFYTDYRFNPGKIGNNRRQARGRPMQMAFASRLAAAGGGLGCRAGHFAPQLNGFSGPRSKINNRLFWPHLA